MGLLLCCPSLALKGAESGLLLWFHTVLPTLLPFMLCSSAIVAFGAVPAITRPLAPLFSRLSLSENGSYALMAGILCGYPMGPKTAADFLAAEEISTEEARYLLAVSAWPSPMFLAGYLAALLPASLHQLVVNNIVFIIFIIIGPGCDYLHISGLPVRLCCVNAPDADQNVFRHVCISSVFLPLILLMGVCLVLC